MIPVRLLDTFERCIKEFFLETAGSPATLSVVREMNAASGNAVAALLGYSDASIKGSLVVMSSPEILKASHPMTALGADVTEVDQLDWIGEIANQVLGRLKNGMLPYGLTLHMATPSIVKGSDLRIAQGAGAESIMRAMRTESGLTFGLVLNVVFAPGFDVAGIDKIEPSATSDAKKEGDGFLF